MRIGLGCTTFNRPDCLAKWKEQIAKHTSMDNVLIYIAEDTDMDRKGVAKRKNECLRALKDCDYIFLFDDDCWPINDNWVEFFINSEKKHLLFLNERLHREFAFENNKINSCGLYRDCGGVFMYMTKECVHKVGAFNEAFKIWGFEHAEYSQRIYKSGLIKSPYLCLNGTDKYLYSCDYSDTAHRSSISQYEKDVNFKLNKPIFEKPIKNIYLPI